MSIAPDTTILDKYRIVRSLGQGATANVWLAEEINFGNRAVAIKEPRPDLAAEDRAFVRQRYEREVRVCAELVKRQAPAIVPALTAEPYADGLLLVLTCMPGGDLAAKLAQQPGGLPVAEALHIAQRLLAALAAIHAHPWEIVHRDIKPSNVLFDAAGEAYLGDFGFAQYASASQDLSKLRGEAVVGTPAYAAPEQLAGTGYLTAAADVYAAGCLIFELLTGKRYKGRVAPGTLPSQVRAGLPAALDAWVGKALAEEPWERWPDGGEMLAALLQQPALSTVPPSAPSQSAPTPTKRPGFWQRVFGTGASGSGEPGDAPSPAIAAPTRQQTSQPMVQPTAKPTKQPLWQQIGIELVRIPAGKFLYGGNQQRHLDEYRISKTPVTNRQYKAFVDATGQAAPAHWQDGKIPAGKEDHPVVNVSWVDAVAFCNWCDLCLPTEEQWEKAARGKDGRTYPWGAQEPDGTRCNFDSSRNDTTPVGHYPTGTSPYGLVDMAGNVSEWCQSWVDGNRYQRVLRGGSWRDSGWNVRCECRDGSWPNSQSDHDGFRVVSPGS